MIETTADDYNRVSLKPRLETQDLTRIYGDRAVVSGVDLRIMPGQVTCLLGPSGCGKSTTLRLIAGVERQTTGTVCIEGQMVSNGTMHAPPEQRGIGLMFQDFALFPHMNVADNVAFGLHGSAAENRLRVAELLERVNLKGFEKTYPHELSGGEQQRVALARALGPRPRVMLMDEPFSGLDNRLRDAVREATLDVLKEENTAVLLVTHDPDEAMRVADEIALMRQGRVVQSAPPYTIYTNPVDRETASFFSDINVLHADVHGALCTTPFGEFLAPGYADGTCVEIVFRPQHVHLDFYREDQGPFPSPSVGMPARGCVKRARFTGRESLIVFTMDDGSEVTASIPQVFLPKPGMAFWLSVRRDRCHVFQDPRR